MQDGYKAAQYFMTKEEMWDRLNTREFPCIRPDDVREWFHENPDDDSLAEALAQVCNRVAILCAESSESNDQWLEAVFYDWDELEEELVQECLFRLNERGRLLDVKGYHFQMRPFMEEHGYRDGRGWWIKAEEEYD